MSPLSLAFWSSRDLHKHHKGVRHSHTQLVTRSYKNRHLLGGPLNPSPLQLPLYCISYICLPFDCSVSVLLPPPDPEYKRCPRFSSLSITLFLNYLLCC